ncbi:MAG: response regulator [Thermodesulfobacteriota bacterium]
MKRLFHSIPIKISITILVIESILLALLGTYYVTRFSREIDRGIREKMVLPAALMSERALTYETVVDFTALGKLVSEEISDAFICQEDGSIYFSNIAERIGTSYRDSLDKNESLTTTGKPENQLVHFTDTSGVKYISALSPIEGYGNLVGYLYIKVKADQIVQRKKRMTAIFMFGSLVAILLTTVIEALFIRRLLLPRIDKTCKVLQRVEGGDLAARISPVQANDEIDTIQRHFNMMITTVEHTTNSLRVLNTAGRKFIEAGSREDIVSIIREVNGQLLGLQLEPACFLDGETTVKNSSCPFLSNLDDTMLSRLISHGFILNNENGPPSSDGDASPDRLLLSLGTDGQRILLSFFTTDKELQLNPNDEDFLRVLLGMADSTLQRLAAKEVERKREAAEAAFKVKLEMLAALENKNQQLEQALKELHESTGKLQEKEWQLMQTRKMEAIGRLAGGIAHDFNNILSAILGYGEFIIEEAPPGSDVAEFATEITKATDRAADLVQQILTFSHQSENKKEIIQPHIIVLEALNMMRSTLPTSISIEDHIDGECGTILANPTNIHQVVVNLCTNARQAMTNDKGNLCVELKRQFVGEEEIPINQDTSAGHFIMLRVSDNGCGVADGDLEKIFEPYFTTKEQGKGSGLGLSVVHGIAQDCQGFVKIASRIDDGTTVAVYFPAQKMVAIEPTKKSLPHQDHVASAMTKIMLVDDEPLLIKVNMKRLEERGYQVEGFTDSRKALEWFRAHQDSIDLLITDQTMPGLTGADLTHAVQQIKPSLPIIMCTGHSETVPEEKALAMGIARYVLKPLHKNELLDAAQEVLQQCGR